MKKIIACIILLVAVVSAFIIVLCDNENSTEGTTYELSSGNFDFDKTWSNLALYKTSNLSYTPLPYEYSSDIYSTYYSYKLCDELDIPIHLNDDLQTLVDSCTSMADLYLLTDLFVGQDIIDDWKTIILSEIQNYRSQNTYHLYKDDEKSNDSTSLFSFYYATRCFELLGVQESLDSDILHWFNSYQGKIRHTKTNDTADFMNKAYQVLVINDYFGTSSDELLLDVEASIEEYAKIIRQLTSNNVPEVIFELESYWYLLDKTSSTDILTKEDFTGMLEKLRCTDGGFSLDGSDYSNPHVMFIVLEIANRYGISLDTNFFYSLIMRHKQGNGQFIPYVLTGDDKSTYYAYKIARLLGHDDKVKLPSNETSIYSVAMKDTTLSTEDLEYIANYIDSITKDQSITSNDLLFMCELLEKCDLIQQNADLKSLMKQYISELNSAVQQKQNYISQRIQLYTALYVYYSAWKDTSVSGEIEYLLSLTPTTLDEIFSFTRLSEVYYGKEWISAVSQKQYTAFTQIIVDSYNERDGYFYYSVEGQQTNMSTIYLGIYLAQTYFQ